jgi:DNA invertase Pin-like site-specific DNA recombinase
MQAVGYIRVSTSDQAENGVSLDAQRDLIETWCKLNGAELVHVYRDEGISGTKTRTQRPGLNDALEHACNLGCPLVVYSLSRLARNTKETIEIGECLSECGADLVSLSEKIDTTSAAGKMVFRMLAVLAEFERDQVSERTKMALAYRKSQGVYLGAPPVGKRVADDGKTLVKDEDEAKLIARAKRLHRSGMSLRKIATKLTDEGYRTRRGNPMNYQTVNELLNR